MSNVNSKLARFSPFISLCNLSFVYSINFIQICHSLTEIFFERKKKQSHRNMINVQFCNDNLPISKITSYQNQLCQMKLFLFVVVFFFGEQINVRTVFNDLQIELRCLSNCVINK